MAAMGAQEAPSTRCAYHVFLSFRGEDTRNTFTDHLYTALIHAGIRTFRDDDGLERGQNITLELKKAIQESRISIIVFSKDYASSRWCLDELLNILEHKKTVLPVFYHVDPSHVRNQIGSFAEAFAIHEERLKAETEERKKAGLDKIKRWKAALREVAELAGMGITDGPESSFIQKIVEEIGKNLNLMVLDVDSHLIGIDSHVKDINSWIRDGSMDAGIVTICGMGGIGKTTIAKIVYNQNFDKFEGSSFLEDIREKSKQPNGLVGLQKQLLSNILKGREENFGGVAEGNIKIRRAICCKRVLVVLDDVDLSDQSMAILKMRDWSYPGSKIIITTRHEQLLTARELHKMHKVNKLNDDESLQLFCWHTFGQDHPTEGYLEHSKSVVHYCGGLPLALKVLGSSLSRTPLNVWESALKKLEAIPDSQILEKLRISFDSLQDDYERDVFLDIACFFVRKDKDFTITILDACGFHPIVEIHNLIDRCLITIDKNNKLTMHQLLRDMGREIIRQESPKEPGKRSRLWHHQHVLSVLNEKTGTDSIEGLILNLNVSKEDRFESHSTSNEVDLQIDAFSRMHRLRLLQLYNARLKGDFEEFPRKLKWLCWRGFPLKSIPSGFPLESLVVLDMRNSSLKQVWNGNKLLSLLKILNLSHSHGLTNTPDFSKVPNLERLILKNCINLIEIHESIGELGRLVLLNLKGCKNLRKIPSKIGQLKSLETLILSLCSKLEKLPTEELSKLESLKMLNMDGIAVNQSPSMTSGVKSWHSHFWLVLGPRRSPESISFSMCSLPRSLSSLSLADCNLSDDAIPKDLGSLSLLQKLDLRGNPICSLPKSIKCLTMLRTLYLINCKTLQFLPELPMNLSELYLDGCRSLERMTNLPYIFRELLLPIRERGERGETAKSLYVRNQLNRIFLDISDCGNLTEVQSLFKLEPIGNFDEVMISNLGLSNLEFLRNIEVCLVNKMTSTKRKVPLQGLYEFDIFSTSLPGSGVPGWFSIKSMGSSKRFKVPSFPNFKIQGLNVCVVYAQTDGYSDDPMDKYSDDPGDPEFSIDVKNRKKDLMWRYSPTFMGVPDDGEGMVWLSHWNLGNQLEAGDEVNVSVFLCPSLELKELGIHVVFEKEEKGTPYNTCPSCPNVNGLDLSVYQPRTRFYFLCHHDFYNFRPLF